MRTFTRNQSMADTELDHLGDFLKNCKVGRAMHVEELDGFFAPRGDRDRDAKSILLPQCHNDLSSFCADNPGESRMPSRPNAASGIEKSGKSSGRKMRRMWCICSHGIAHVKRRACAPPARSSSEDAAVPTIDLLTAHTGCPCYRCRRDMFACLSHPSHYLSELFLCRGDPCAMGGVCSLSLSFGLPE
jgi:hypothetical protein